MVEIMEKASQETLTNMKINFDYGYRKCFHWFQE